MNHRIRQSGGKVWFTPSLQVIYRPRSTFAALGRQYFYYGRWRRVVARHHVGTINLRYLAPPAMVVVSAAAVVGGFLWWPAWLLPAAYGLGIAAGGVLISTGEAGRTRLLTPFVLGVMHWSWGIGFLTSPPRLAR
jgi:succinoglycan biosynthesis protein ExoA